MSQNPSNTYQWTRGAEGSPIDPSVYRREVEFDDPQSGSTSGPSGSQLAQNSTSNTSGQQGNNNQGANSTSHPQSYGGSASGSNTHPNPQMATYQGQTQQQEPFTNLGAASGPPGGFQNQGSATGPGQGGAQGGGHGGGSTSATWGSSGSGR